MNIKPRPPEDLDGEALLEWERVCLDLDEEGLLAATDRALLTLYVRTWAAWNDADKMVQKFGSVIKYSNGVPGASPHFKTGSEFAKQLRAIIGELGLTPVARAKRNMRANPEEEDAGPLQF